MEQLRYSWLSETVAGPVADLHIVRVFAAHFPTPSPPFLTPDNEAILGRTGQWVVFPFTRVRVEQRETERLCDRQVPIESYARRRTSEAANRFYRRQHAGSRESQDIRWTAQCVGERDKFDELLYRVYSKNLDVFGEKAERDLYTLKLADGKEEYAIAHRGDENCDTIRLRVFAVLKEAAHPSFADFGSTWFSPVLAIVGVVSRAEDDDSGVVRMLDLSLSLEEAFWNRDANLRIDRLVLQRATNALDRLGGVNWQRLSPTTFTQFSAFVMGLRESEMPREFISKGPSKSLAHPAGGAVWRRHFLHLLARMSIPTFHVTDPRVGFWKEGARLRWTADFEGASLKDFVKHFLPKRSSLLSADDITSVLSPGRKILLRHLLPEQVHDIERHKGRDYDIAEDHNPHTLLDSVAWNMLLLSLSTTQEALLARLHLMLSDDGDVGGVKEALRDFDDFYDIEMFDLPNGALYQDSFAAIKHALDLNHQYDMLHKKLEITVSNIHADNLKWAIVAFLFLAGINLVAPPTLRSGVVALFSVVVIAFVILRPVRHQIRPWFECTLDVLYYLPDVVRHFIRGAYP